METLANPHMLLVFPRYSEAGGEVGCALLEWSPSVFLQFSGSSSDSSAGSRPRGEAIVGRLTHFHSPPEALGPFWPYPWPQLFQPSHNSLCHIHLPGPKVDERVAE